MNSTHDQDTTITMPSHILLSDYPQLKQIAWEYHVPSIEREVAYLLYQRNWRWVEEDALSESERDLIRQLETEFGGGHPRV